MIHPDELPDHWRSDWKPPKSLVKRKLREARGEEEPPKARKKGSKHVNFHVDLEADTRWRAAAKSAGLSYSAWLRKMVGRASGIPSGTQNR